MDITEAVEELTAAMDEYEKEFTKSASQISALLGQKPLQVDSLRTFLKQAELAARKSCESERSLHELLLANDWEITRRDAEYPEPETQLQTRMQKLGELKKFVVQESLKHSVHTKLASYLLCENSPNKKARDKAKWFREALGFTPAHLSQLEQQIQLSFQLQVFGRRQDEWGDFFNQVLPIKGANGRTIEVIFVWRVDQDGYLYLITSRLGKK